MTQLSLMSTRQTPRTRGACEGGERPCRWKACRYHLWGEDERPGRPWDGKRPHTLVVAHHEETCALDLADRGGMSRAEVGEVMGLGYERVRQLELRALEKLRAGGVDLRELVEQGEPANEQRARQRPRVRLPVVDQAQGKLPL